MERSGVISTGKASLLKGAVMTPPDSEYRTIPLTRGQVVVVDEFDYERLSQFRWYAWLNKTNNSFYARRKSPRVNGKQDNIYMHREILGLGGGRSVLVDHIDRNTLNNRRSNLRCVNLSQNSMNSKARGGSASGLKGVSLRRNGKWVAAIMIHGRNRSLGTFTNKEEAHAAYCEAAKQHFGEYARFA